MNTDIPKKIVDNPIFPRQQSNIMANLQNRIDIAAANHDHHLLELLANERTQLESYWRNTPSSASRQRRVTQLWQYITKEIASRSQLSVERRVTANGEEWWHVADPRSGKTFNAESFSVAMHWIERNRLGH